MAFSEPPKRKRYVDKEQIDTYCIIDYIDLETSEFSVVKSDKIIFNNDDETYGTVRERNVDYKVKIIKKGSKEYIERKAAKYEKKASITTEEEDTIIKMKKKTVKNKNNVSESGSNFIDLGIENYLSFNKNNI